MPTNFDFTVPGYVAPGGSAVAFGFGEEAQYKFLEVGITTDPSSFNFILDKFPATKLDLVFTLEPTTLTASATLTQVSAGPLVSTTDPVTFNFNVELVRETLLDKDAGYVEPSGADADVNFAWGLPYYTDGDIFLGGPDSYAPPRATDVDFAFQDGALLATVSTTLPASTLAATAEREAASEAVTFTATLATTLQPAAVVIEAETLSVSQGVLAVTLESVTPAFAAVATGVEEAELAVTLEAVTFQASAVVGIRVLGATFNIPLDAPTVVAVQLEAVRLYPPLAIRPDGRHRRSAFTGWAEQLINDGTAHPHRAWSSTKLNLEFSNSVREGVEFDGVVEVETIGKGVIVRSADGSKWRVRPSNTGTTIVEAA